eukprot:04612.XXX_304_519_1 [CDS] Oithona nana genome sequencing.
MYIKCNGVLPSLSPVSKAVREIPNSLKYLKTKSVTGENLAIVNTQSSRPNRHLPLALQQMCGSGLSSRNAR